MRTGAQLLTAILQTLQDTGAATWGATETTDAFTKAKTELADLGLPYVVKHTLSTVADSRELDLSAINNLIRVRELEYPEDKWPRQYLDFEQRGHVLTMLLDNAPSTVEDANLWVSKPHVIMATTDLVGAVDLVAGYAAGATTIHIDGLAASDTLEEGAVFTIAGMSGSYRLTAAATLATNECDIIIYPGLAAALANDAVLTFFATTLFNPVYEELFINLVAGNLAHDKTYHADYRNGVNLGSDAFAKLLRLGTEGLVETKKRIARQAFRESVPTVMKPRG